jgi:hypothetical protein
VEKEKEERETERETERERERERGREGERGREREREGEREMEAFLALYPSSSQGPTPNLLRKSISCEISLRTNYPVPGPVQIPMALHDHAQANTHLTTGEAVGGSACTSTRHDCCIDSRGGGGGGCVHGGSGQLSLCLRLQSLILLQVLSVLRSGSGVLADTLLHQQHATKTSKQRVGERSTTKGRPAPPPQPTQRYS